MKHSNLKITSMLFVLAIVCLTLFTSPLNAQIGQTLTSQLGIYGSAPEAIRSNVSYVRLDTYPESEGGEIILPLNGAKNFNFFYNADGSGFLAGGSYKLGYWNATLTTRYGAYDFLLYSPNNEHTNGYKVRDLNILTGASVSLGIHGILLGYPLGGGTPVPIQNATVRTVPNKGGSTVTTRTNANGYFSSYYNNGAMSSFLSAYNVHWGFIINGSQNGCNYSYTNLLSDVIWTPNATVGDPYYYIGGADVEANIPVLNCLEG